MTCWVWEPKAERCCCRARRGSGSRHSWTRLLKQPRRLGPLGAARHRNTVRGGLQLFGPQPGSLPASGGDGLSREHIPRRAPVALGFQSGPPPQRLVVSNATLALLEKAAADQPLLVIIDDLPWIDRPSAAVLDFAARRMTGSGVSLLAAARSGSPALYESGGLQEYALAPFDGGTADHLLTSEFAGLAGRVRERLMTTAQGNPLALLELPTALRAAQLAALEELPAVLPLPGTSLGNLFGSRIAGLPERSALLVGGAGGDRRSRHPSGGRAPGWPRGRPG